MLSLDLSTQQPQSFCCDDSECKNRQHQNCLHAACRRNLIMANILNNSESLNASRNNSFCVRQGSGINHGAHAKRIAQLLLSPTGGSSIPTYECTSCPPRRESTISESVCACFLPFSPFIVVLHCT